MRLGDLDKLKRTLKSNCKPELCHNYGSNWCEHCCQINDFEDLIDNAETVSPEEFKPLIDKVVEIIPDLTNAIIEQLPKIISSNIKCSECTYYKDTWTNGGADDDK